MTTQTFKRENVTEIYYIKLKKGISKKVLLDPNFKNKLEHLLQSQTFKNILSNPKGFLVSDKSTTFLLIFGRKEYISGILSFQIEQLLTQEFSSFCFFISYKNYVQFSSKNYLETKKPYRRISTVRGAIKKLLDFFPSMPTNIYPLNTTLGYFLISWELALSNKSRKELEREYSFLLE